MLYLVQTRVLLIFCVVMVNEEKCLFLLLIVRVFVSSLSPFALFWVFRTGIEIHIHFCCFVILYTDNYTNVAARIREILEHVGLAQESLPSNVVASAQVLASVANLLNIRDTELSRLAFTLKYSNFLSCPFQRQ
jgi:hypothetical protein